MPMVAYVALCVVVPAAWGVAMYRAFDWLGRRRKRLGKGDDATASRDDHPPIDYSI